MCFHTANPSVALLLVTSSINVSGLLTWLAVCLRQIKLDSRGAQQRLSSLEKKGLVSETHTWAWGGQWAQTLVVLPLSWGDVHTDRRLRVCRALSYHRGGSTSFPALCTGELHLAETTDWVLNAASVWVTNVGWMLLKKNVSSIYFLYFVLFWKVV